MFRTWWQKLFSFPRTRIARRRGYRPPNSLTRRTFRLSMTALEDRLAPATFTDNGTTLNLVLNTANVNAAIVSSGTSYTVTLTGDTWTGTNDANVTGNGTATLTVTAAGIAAFTNQISVADAAAGGDSVTFNDSGANLYANNFNVKLSNAAAGSITFNGQSSFGAHSLSASTTRNIAANSGAAIFTTSGDITLSANQQATPTSGNFVGIDVNGAIISTATGGISLTGAGGTDAATGSHVGVLIHNAAKVQSTGSGTVTIHGTGGSGTSLNAGVEVTDANTLVTSVVGAIIVTGTGGNGSTDHNVGVFLTAGGQVTSTGTTGSAATVTINGTGGSGTTQNAGVLVQGANSRVSSVTGAVNIDGAAGGGSPGDFNIGVALESGGQVVSMGTGAGAATITLTGAGGSVGGQEYGVGLLDSGTAVTSVAGAVKITGTGGGTGGRNAGVALLGGAQVNSTGTGGSAATITLVGTGGTANSENFGVFIEGGSQVTSADGAISVTGTGGTGLNSFAVALSSTGGTIASTGGNISVTGDSMSLDTIGAVVNADSHTIFLQPKTPGTAINLGGPDAAGTLGLSDGELGRITAGILRIGNASSGGITVSAPITSHAGYNTLSLTSGAAVTDNAAADTITVTSLAVQAVTGISLDTVVSNLAASDSGAAASGNVRISNTGALALPAGPTGVDGLVGVTRSGGSLGSITLSAASPLTVNAPVTDNTGGDITLTAGAANSNNAADVLTINANVTASGGNGSITLNGNSLVVNAATVSAVGNGNITANFGGTGGAATFNNGSTVSAVNGNIAVDATASTTLNGNAALTVTGSGGITLTTGAANEASTARIVAPNLALVSSATPGTFSLDTSTLNAVGTITANTNSVVNFRNSTSLMVGSFTTNNHEATLCTILGDISITQPVNVGTATLRLSSAGAVTQATTGKITADSLGVVATGDIALDLAMPANHVPNIVALNTGGAIKFKDDVAFKVGMVGIGSSMCFGGANGIGGNNVEICSAGDITLTAAVAAGGGTARIQAGGNVSQNMNGTITAMDLGVRANGNIDLCVPGAPNAVVGMFAADATGGPVGSFVHFLDGSGFTVGTVTASPCFTPDAVGVQSNNGDIDLISETGPIKLTGPVKAGAGTVRIDAGGTDATGSIYQTAPLAGMITAANLGVVANGNVDLCQTANTVTSAAFTGNVAIHDLTAGAFVRFLDTAGFTVGTVTGDTCVTGADPVNFPAAGINGVVTVNGDVDLVSLTGATAGPIRLAQPINAGTATVLLDAGGAGGTDANGLMTSSVYQTAAGAGKITAQNLGVVARGNVDLCQTANAVTNANFTSNVAITDLTAGTFVHFLDTDGFTVGTVTGDTCVSTADPIVFPTPTSVISGVATANGNVDLVSQAGPIRLAQPIDTGAASTSTVLIDAGGSGGTTATGSTTGSVYQVETAPMSGVFLGAITAQDLAVTANGDVDLCQTPNFVSHNFSAKDLAKGLIAFKNSGSFSVDTVTPAAGDMCAPGATGVTTTDGGIDLVSTLGSITLNKVVTAGNGGTVRLSAGGGINQNAGVITGANLSAAAKAGDINLCVAVNNVNVFAARNDTAGGFIAFLNNPSITVGTVTGDFCVPGNVAGVVSNSGDVDLVSKTGAINLLNKVDTTLDGTVTSTATVRLDAFGADATGSVYQTPAGSGGDGRILAQNLGVVGHGLVDLCQTPNAVSGHFAALDLNLGAPVRFHNAPGFTVGGVTGDACVSTADPVNFPAAGIAFVRTNNGDASLLSDTGALSLAAPVNTSPFVAGANAATVRLQAGSDITQIAAGPITAATLAVNSTAGNIGLDQGNVITPNPAANPPVPGTFAAFAQEGDISFKNTSALILDTVPGDVCVTTAVVGVSTVPAGQTTLRGAVRLQTVGGNFQVGTGANTETGAAQPIFAGLTQTGTGTVITGTFGVSNTGATTGDVSLLNPANNVGTFAASNAAPDGRVDLATLGNLSLGTVTAAGTFVQVRGIAVNGVTANTINGGQITVYTRTGSNIRTGGNFTADDLTTNAMGKVIPLITLGTGNFLLNPGQAGPSSVRFNAEATTTGLFRLGTRNTNATPATEAQAPRAAGSIPTDTIPNANNPFDKTSTNNVRADAFTVRPSSNIQIIVNGNMPDQAPGDTLNLLTASVSGTITFTPGGIGAGRFDFGGGPKPLLFTGIESVGGRGILAFAVQTGPTTYNISAEATINGQVLTGGVRGAQIPPNPFVVSPNVINPTAPFGAPRLAVGDFNGDSLPDLIIANGPANAPVVTVVDGAKLFSTIPQFIPSGPGQNLVAQFLAYGQPGAQPFLGGVFVAAGNLDGKANGQVEIVTGADSGGGPQVRAFVYSGPPAAVSRNVNGDLTNNVYNSTAPFTANGFPASGFYAYDPQFQGGVRVATGDVNGDGKADIITAAGPGGGPHVKVIDVTKVAGNVQSNGVIGNGALIASFYAYSPVFGGGVYVTAGDYNNDGRADVITGAGQGGGPHVKVVSGAGLAAGGAQASTAIANPLASFLAFGPDGGPSLFGADLGMTTGVGSLAFSTVGLMQGGLTVTTPVIVVGSARGPHARVAAFQANTSTPAQPTPVHLSFAQFLNAAQIQSLAPPMFIIDPGTFDLPGLPQNKGDLLDPADRNGIDVGGGFFA
jgi:hypothetical protein